MKNNEITIKQVKTMEEIQKVAELAKVIWNQHFTPIIGQKQVDFMVEKFQSKEAMTNQIQNDGYQYYMVFSQDILIGYTGIRLEEDKLFLSKLYVNRDCRGKGIGRSVVEFLKELAITHKKSQIWLTVNRENSNTIEAYKKFGFVITEEADNPIGNGFYMNDYYMRLYL